MTADDVIEKILVEEGGVADVHDGKGITRFGQTPEWLTQYNLPTPATRVDAGKNYAEWMRLLSLDQIVARDAFIGWIVTDHAVMSGITNAVKTLQQALGVKEDGALGPQTLQAIPVNSPHFARRLVAAKVRYFGGIGGSKVIDRREWLKGWFNRLSRQIEALP